MKKIKLRQAVVVEGKYDKIRLASVIDGVIIVTNGFGLYRNEETKELIKFYAKTCGIIILTDSDTAGRQIRGHIKSIVPEGKIINVYVPEIFGKEKRKTSPSKEGKIGVEGMSNEILRTAFSKAGLLSDEKAERTPVTKIDFITLGLSGAQNSSSLRKLLLKSLELPLDLSAAALRDAINTMFDREDFLKFFEKFSEGQEK